MNFVDDIQFLALSGENLSRNRKLSHYIENVKSLHKLATTNHLDFQSMIASYLQAGCEMFQLEIGILSCITGNNYLVEAIYPSSGAIQQGDNFALTDTYCSEVYRAKHTLAFPHVGNDTKVRQHPCYINTKLESYLSAPVLVNGMVYGTFNFTSLKPRLEGFSIHEGDILELMATTIGHSLESLSQKTRLEQRTNQLLETVKQMNEFVGRVAHDLRGPIGAMQSFADLALPLIEHKEALSYVENVEAISKRSLELVDDLLDLSLLGQNKISIKSSTWKWDELESTLAKTVQQSLKQKELTIEIEAPDDLSVHSDQIKLFQVLSNLLSNSIKFTANGGSVTLKVAPTEDGLLFSIADTGVGIDPERLPHLFDKLQSFSTNGTNGEQGTGLGLPLCAEIVQALSSTLKVKSLAGEGTEFYFELPQ